MRGSDKELGGRAERPQTLQQGRPGLELCPVNMTATVSFVEHLPWVLLGVVDKDVSFRVGGFIPSPGGLLDAESSLAQDYSPRYKGPAPSPKPGMIVKGSLSFSTSTGTALWLAPHPKKPLCDHLHLRVCFPGSPIHDIQMVWLWPHVRSLGWDYFIL